MVSVSNLLTDMVQSYHEEFLNDRTAVNWLMGLDDPNAQFQLVLSVTY